MPRKLRVEYPGACYHVINRGNLVSGMQWLESTFAARYNRRRKESGHLFQGRYKALVVEGGDALGRVCHYIHLNSVRGGIVPHERLSEHRYGSYGYLFNKAARPSFLSLQAALQHAGGQKDDPYLRSVYEQYLALLNKEGPAGCNASYQKLSTGWALGSSGFRENLLRQCEEGFDLRAWDSAGTQASRSEAWAQALSSVSKLLMRIPGYWFCVQISAPLEST